MVTSSLSLPSLLAYLSSCSKVLLLRAYFTILIRWVAPGRPALNIESFMTTTSVKPPVPTTPAPSTPLTTETTLIPNPFLPILQSAMTHPNDRLSKIQRAFAHYNTLYGRRPAGYFKDTALEDAESLDGSLFLRVSLLTAEYVGWVREGMVPKLLGIEPHLFSFEGFYERIVTWCVNGSSVRYPLSSGAPLSRRISSHTDHLIYNWARSRCKTLHAAVCTNGTNIVGLKRQCKDYSHPPANATTITSSRCLCDITQHQSPTTHTRVRAVGFFSIFPMYLITIR